MTKCLCGSEHHVHCHHFISDNLDLIVASIFGIALAGGIIWLTCFATSKIVQRILGF